MAKAKYQPYAYFSGEIVPTEKAVIPVMTNALQYGTGIFGGIRGYFNPEKKFVSVFRIEDHYRRFIKSLKILGVEFDYTLDQLKKITIELLKMNNPESDVYFRPFSYLANTDLTPNIYQVKFDFTLYMTELGEYLPLEKGIKVKISSFRRINDNAIPSRAKISGGYINSALAKKEAMDDGYDEAIFLTDKGDIAEGSAMNVFIVRNGKVITPSVSEDILEGITRGSVIQIAKDLGYEVEERTIDRTEIYIADEAFFCGTGAQIAWIDSVDNRVIGDGKIGNVSKQIKDKFFQIVRGNDEQYSNWCTKIDIK